MSRSDDWSLFSHLHLDIIDVLCEAKCDLGVVSIVLAVPGGDQHVELLLVGFDHQAADNSTRQHTGKLAG